MNSLINREMNFAQWRRQFIHYPLRDWASSRPAFLRQVRPRRSSDLTGPIPSPGYCQLGPVPIPAGACSWMSTARCSTAPLPTGPGRACVDRPAVPGASRSMALLRWSVAIDRRSRSAVRASALAGSQRAARTRRDASGRKDIVLSRTTSSSAGPGSTTARGGQVAGTVETRASRWRCTTGRYRTSKPRRVTPRERSPSRSAPTCACSRARWSSNCSLRARPKRARYTPS